MALLELLWGGAVLASVLAFPSAFGAGAKAPDRWKEVDRWKDFGRPKEFARASESCGGAALASVLASPSAFGAGAKAADLWKEVDRWKDFGRPKEFARESEPFVSSPSARFETNPFGPIFWLSDRVSPPGTSMPGGPQQGIIARLPRFLLGEDELTDRGTAP